MRYASYVLLWLIFADQVIAAEVGCHSEFVPAGGGYQFTDQTMIQYKVPAGTVIGNVHVTNLDVFNEANPKEGNALYRFLNRVHIETKPTLIETQILFEKGNVYDARLIKESARLLRDQNYLADADIRPVSLCDKEVNVEVVTRDVWSLSLDLSFDRSGGENNFGIGVGETNLMGRGSELRVKTKQDVDRDSNELEYKNNNLKGSRLRTRLLYSDNDDGSEVLALLALPFYSLESKRSWILMANNVEQIDAQYFRGNDITEVEQDSEAYRLGFGFSKGLRNGVTRRWGIGYGYRKQEFVDSDDLPPPSPFPTDKTLSFPYIEFSSIEDNYVQRVNINQIERIEDLHIGRSFLTRFGYSAESFGGDVDRLVFEGRFRDTLVYSGHHLFTHEFQFSGLQNFDTDEVEDVLLDYRLRYLFSASKYRSYVVDFRTIYSKNLNSHLQVTLGGDNGLRAFDNRYQVGDRSLTLNLERRTFTDIHLFNLIRVGWAFFIDVGRAWDPEVDTGFEDEYLANVGFGLRLASSKAKLGRFMHIDLAVPLTNRDEPDVESHLVSVRLENRF